MIVNPFRDVYAWFLNVLACLPFPFYQFILFCLFCLAFIWIMSLWRDA